ncbi:unnamed protein product [Sphagnum troendelagicum]|uniref:Uncharacterized protein n=1 Tax=Sphagnum troendelagicum TaxID=128251 RepID=A0ABP0UHL0_9BRYO
MPIGAANELLDPVHYHSNGHKDTALSMQQPDLGPCVPSAISLEMLHPPCHPVCRLVPAWLKTCEESSIVKICKMTLAPSVLVSKLILMVHHRPSSRASCRYFFSSLFPKFHDILRLYP